jgi:uncharacterized membrane protein
VSLTRGWHAFIQPSVKVGLTIWPSPFAAVLTSYIVSSMIIVGASTLQSGHAFSPSRPLRGQLWFVLIDVLNGLAMLLLYAALANGPVALVAPLVASYPLVTIVGSSLLQWGDRRRAMACNRSGGHCVGRGPVANDASQLLSSSPSNHNIIPVVTSEVTAIALDAGSFLWVSLTAVMSATILPFDRIDIATNAAARLANSVARPARVVDLCQCA